MQYSIANDVWTFDQHQISWNDVDVTIVIDSTANFIEFK